MQTDTGTGVQDDARQSFIEAARRKQIIECAIETIAEIGYARASLAEIAKRAGISKSAIAYYFTTRDELVLQTVEHIYRTGAAFMLPRLLAQKTSVDTLRTYIETNVAFIGSNRKAVAALIDIISGFRDDAGPIAAESRWSRFRHVRVGGDPPVGPELGEFRDFSTSVMATAIRAAIDALPWRFSVDPSLDVDMYAAELADIFHRATVNEGGTS